MKWHLLPPPWSRCDDLEADAVRARRAPWHTQFACSLLLLWPPAPRSLRPITLPPTRTKVKSRSTPMLSRPSSVQIQNRVQSMESGRRLWTTAGLSYLGYLSFCVSCGVIETWKGGSKLGTVQGLMFQRGRCGVRFDASRCILTQVRQEQWQEWWIGRWWWGTAFCSLVWGWVLGGDWRVGTDIISENEARFYTRNTDGWPSNRIHRTKSVMKSRLSRLMTQYSACQMVHIRSSHLKRF